MCAAKKSQVPRYSDAIQCPVDLDGLIMSSDCTPEFLEQNLDVASDILYDAIVTSTMAGWLLRIPVLTGFSRKFRSRLFESFDAFPRVNRIYFELQMDVSLLKFNDIWEDYKSGGGGSVDTKSIQMYNPMKMLGNNFTKQDISILAGSLDLRRFIIDQIHAFLESGKKDDVDFSYSLFLPDILNPKFFFGLSEAEQLVVLGNLERYFKFMGKFRTMGPLKVVGRRELNLILVLLKHILSCEYPYTNRVKMFAWKEFMKELNRLATSHSHVGAFAKVKMLDSVELDKKESDMLGKLAKRDITPDMLDEWVRNADGVFESFELDCTLHNLDASDFALYILEDPVPKVFNMTSALVDFQDDKDKVFKDISRAMQIYS